MYYCDRPDHLLEEDCRRTLNLGYKSPVEYSVGTWMLRMLSAKDGGLPYEVSEGRLKTLSGPFVNLN